jgi:hypothetical protein
MNAYTHADDKLLFLYSNLFQRGAEKTNKVTDVGLSH